jgi:hypothetical protein
MMSSQHRDAPLNVRPDTAARRVAQAVLSERERDMTAFITACLATVAAEPDAMLALLDPHWPTPKPRGRPPRPQA